MQLKADHPSESVTLSAGPVRCKCQHDDHCCQRQSSNVAPALKAAAKHRGAVDLDASSAVTDIGSTFIQRPRAIPATVILLARPANYLFRSGTSLLAQSKSVNNPGRAP